MVPLIVLIVVLVVGGGIALVVKSKKSSAASEEAGTGPNEFLQSPPTSFPSSSGSARSLEAGADASPSVAESTPIVIGGPVSDEAEALDDQPVDERPDDELPDDELVDEPDDDVIVARFKTPGARSAGSGGPAKPVIAPPVYHLEGPPVVEPERASEAEPVAESEPVVEAEPVTEVESETDADPADEPTAPVLALVPDEPESASEPESGAEIRSGAEAVAADGPVIDLIGEEAVVTPAEAVVIRRLEDEAWEDVVLEPEPDAVDHVLQALINRARFKQVEVEAVATELVERADLQGQEVSDVLAELVGRADDSTLDAARTSELTLFNDEVPSRPGQLTDFARLAPTEKKRIIVRVLCLLVARSEDQQLPPRAEGESAEPRSWPLARAVWPLASSDDDGEAQLPSRRLAKSG